MPVSFELLAPVLKSLLIVAVMGTTLYAKAAENKPKIKENAPMFTSDTFKTPSGKDVKITFIKHASLMIDYNGKIIQIDPVSEFADYAKFPRADYILITHEHGDHFNRQAIAAARQASTKIISNTNVQEQLGQGTAMKNGDKLSPEEDIIIRAVPAYNFAADKQKFHPHTGRDNGYVLTLGGLNIYIAGDTEDIPEMKNLGPIDIAFLPVNQPYTMTPKQAIHAAEMIRPKILYPYHYSDTKFDDSFTNTLESAGISVRFRDMQ